ncbi:aminotransferase class V-fold PLP-dependent enzyme [Halorubrum rubrum]|uniref:Aminotransferase class V-fold PLP-dependent enzyme n=1 Tax=Halorubrum rubrum TaxID=1126240 RepID=A0ABD5QZW2_9EURY|nr:aminotransferase class V-fold PLP-dependent enzyme [Halorubrum rubrum]
MSNNDVYDELGVPTVVNASGTKTRIGGSLIRKEALQAMNQAAESFVRLSDLQAAASDRIADATGAEAGYVTNGAASALLLGTAACIAGSDPGVMSQLPDTKDIPSEVVMPRTHRTGYDHAIRGSGATISDIGSNDRRIGTGSSDVEPWEYANAIGEETVAVAHIYKDYATPNLAKVCEIAHDHDVPVIVDAAAELPPIENLSWFTEQGADLVAFSGGKAVRGPQSTGFLAGRRDLIESVAFQHLDMHAAPEIWDPPERLVDTNKIDGVPEQGIGRPLKVGKEELVGLLTALDLFIEEDHEATRTKWRRRADSIAAALGEVDVLSTSIDDSKKSVTPTVIVDVDESLAPVTTAELLLALKQEKPRVFVGADDLADQRFTVNPMCLSAKEVDYVVDRIRANVRGDSAAVTDGGPDVDEQNG